MKKILIALILVAIVFSVCSCSKTKKGASVTTEAPTTTEVQEPTVTFPTEEEGSSKKSGEKSKTTTTAKSGDNNSKSNNKNNSNKKSKSESGKTTTQKQTTTKKVEVNTPSSKNETPIIPID